PRPRRLRPDAAARDRRLAAARADPRPRGPRRARSPRPRARGGLPPPVRGVDPLRLAHGALHDGGGGPFRRRRPGALLASARAPRGLRRALLARRPSPPAPGPGPSPRAFPPPP